MDKFAFFLLILTIAGAISKADSFWEEVGSALSYISPFPEAEAARLPPPKIPKGFSAAQANRLTNGGRRKAPSTKRTTKNPLHTSTARPEDDLSFLDKPADKATLKQKERVHKHTRWQESLDYEYARNKERLDQQHFLEKFIPTEHY